MSIALVAPRSTPCEAPAGMASRPEFRSERSERGLSEDGMICPPGAFA